MIALVLVGGCASVVVIIGAILWFLQIGNQALQEQERQAEIETIDIDENELWGLQSDVAGREWIIHFPTMKARHQQVSYEYEAVAEFSDVYHLRRTESGDWKAKLTRRDFDKRVKAFSKRCEQTPDARLDAEKRAEREEARQDFERGPRWDPLYDELAARIETGYQRYLRQG